MARGAETPEWLESEPVSMSEDDFYLKAFWELSTERQLGFTVGPIPTTSIYVYASTFDIPSYMMELFQTVIRAMDRTYLEWAEKARSKANKRGATVSHIWDSTTKQAKT